MVERENALCIVPLLPSVFIDQCVFLSIFQALFSTCPPPAPILIELFLVTLFVVFIYQCAIHDYLVFYAHPKLKFNSSAYQNTIQK